MVGRQIHYTVIAFREEEVQRVIDDLKDPEKRKDLTDELKKNWPTG